jgi:guanine deaminase
MPGLRGAVFTPDGGLLRFERDGLLRWEDGWLIDADEPGDAEPQPDVLLIPGLIDSHIHLPQYRVRGRFQEALLPWLRGHIWPEEARFAEREYRESVTREFQDGLLSAGTTAALVYGAPAADSAHAVLRDLSPLTIRGGDVLMDRNGLEDLLRPTEEALVDAEALANEYGARYVLTPRFVPTCTAELMAGCGSLLARTPARLQTHLAENIDEVAWVMDLHPDMRSYAAVYAHYGLFGPRSVFGHCIHLDDLDLRLLSRSGSWVSHCPTSNIALGSGRMPLERMQKAGIQVALGTDVGAGPDVSMLDVMRSCLDVHAGIVDLSPGDVLRLASRASAQAMGEDDRGELCPGRRADIVALRLPGGLQKSDDGQTALWRVLEEFGGRWTDAIAGVWIGGERIR